MLLELCTFRKGDKQPWHMIMNISKKKSIL